MGADPDRDGKPVESMVFTMLIACVQTDVTFASPEANLSRVVGHLEEAMGRGAELVVFPECALCGYSFESREEAWAQAIGADDGCFVTLAKLASRGPTHLTIGFLERDGDRLYNASALIGPQGVLGVYRKIHLPQMGVDRFVDRGDRPYRAFDTGAARVGMAICYDSSFPEPMRVLGLAGADVIALGTNWPIAAERTALLVPPSRSMENHLFFAAANRVGTERGFHFCGRSSICGPDGVVVARCDHDRETIVYADIEPAEARNKRIERTVGRHAIDRFGDRRPEFYGDLLRTDIDLG